MGIDVIGIGNAIVDVLAQTPDTFLEEEKLDKGAMALIDPAQASALYAKMAPGVEVSGGSVANSCVGVTSLGGTAGYIGKVAADQLGEVFAHDIRAAGVAFDTPPGSPSGPATARCLILVTPDAQRTLNTYLGACVELGPEDIDEARILDAKITYLEGYLWDPPQAKEAMLKAANIAAGGGRRVALSLSDSFCVDRHRAEFANLLDHHVDVLFANEAEALSLCELDDFDAAAKALQGRAEILVLTRSEKGSVVVTKDSVVEVPAAPVNKVLDTTGAGDLFAAGFLYGLSRELPMARCAEIGAIAAAEVISHFGARPERSLAELIG